MPAAWDEFSSAELAPALGDSRGAAEDLLGLAWDLEVKLPGTRAAFRAGIVTAEKAEIIAAATAVLDPGEARAAEALVLGRAGSLTPGGLRSAIARAVMEVAPGKAKKRREQAARDARVERWAEDSGNAALAGRELPPAQVLAADQRVTAWAKELKRAGLDGTMDELRARAYLDILLGTDSRPPGGRTGGDGADGGGGPDEDSGPGGGGPGPSGPPGPSAPAPAGPLAGVIPPGFAGKVNLTVPLATLLGLADRPGEMAGIGPLDPGLARDLAGAAAPGEPAPPVAFDLDGMGRARARRGAHARVVLHEAAVANDVLCAAGVQRLAAAAVGRERGRGEAGCEGENSRSHSEAESRLSARATLAARRTSARWKGRCRSRKREITRITGSGCVTGPMWPTPSNS